jgi:hypothetical protein
MKKIWGASSGMTLLYEIVGQGFSLAIFLAIEFQRPEFSPSNKFEGATPVQVIKSSFFP